MMKQPKLIDTESDWEREWQGMPEYNQERFDPIRVIKICFKSERDIVDFGECIGQKITDAYNTYWYPKLNMKTVASEIYGDES